MTHTIAASPPLDGRVRPTGRIGVYSREVTSATAGQEPGSSDSPATAGGSRSLRAWEQVVEWVEQRILSGQIRVGDQLPAERELAAQLGLSRSAVREAVRTLQANGVVRSSVGAGPSGGTTVTAVPHHALTRLLRLHVALANFPIDDVTEVRVVLERLSASLASRHAGLTALRRMRETVERMDAEGLSREDFNALDTDFHVAIAEAAGNSLATDLTVAIRESLRLPILAGFKASDDWDSLNAMLRREHHAILDAVEAREPDRAAELVEQHIRSAYERMPSLHGQWRGVADA